MRLAVTLAAALTLSVSAHAASAAGEHRFADVACSRDLGHTWGTYATPAPPGGTASKGFHTRVWVGASDASWTVALDAVQPVVQ